MWGLEEEGKKKKWEHSFLEINLKGNEKSGFLPLLRAVPTLNLHKSPAATRVQQATVFGICSWSIHKNGTGFSSWPHCQPYMGLKPIIPKEAPHPVTLPCNSTSTSSFRNFPTQAQRCPCPVWLKGNRDFGRGRTGCRAQPRCSRNRDGAGIWIQNLKLLAHRLNLVQSGNDLKTSWCGFLWRLWQLQPLPKRGMCTWQSPAAFWVTSGDPKWERWGLFHTCTQRTCLSQVLSASDPSCENYVNIPHPLSAFFCCLKYLVKECHSLQHHSPIHLFLGCSAAHSQLPLEIKPAEDYGVHPSQVSPLVPSKSGENCRRNSHTEYPEMPWWHWASGGNREICDSGSHQEPQRTI